MQIAQDVPQTAVFVPAPPLPFLLVGGSQMPLNTRMTPSATVKPQAEPNGRSFDELLVAIGETADRKAFGALFSHFAPRIKSYFRRAGVDDGLAEELTQEVMVTVWRRAETFDPGRAAASTWIFTVARNKRIDALRREQRPEIDPNDPVLVPDGAEPADQTLEATQAADRVRKAIRTLPEEQRDILQRAYFDDKAHRAIAIECDLPLGTVKSRLRLALARLRRELEDGSP